MTDKDIKELFKDMPEDIVQGFKNLAEAFKRKDVEYEHNELLRYRTLREREQRKECLPEPEFTKAKRAERTSEVTSEISEDLEEAAEMFIDSLIPTEVDTVTPFAAEYVIGLLNKAIEFGANWQKQQMINKGAEWLRKCLDNGMWIDQFLSEKDKEAVILTFKENMEEEWRL